MRTMGEFFYDSTTQQVIDADWLEWHKMPRRRAEPVVRVKRDNRDHYRTQDEDALPDEWDNLPEPTESDLRDIERMYDMAHQMGIENPERIHPDFWTAWFNLDS
jgi:hypothetical protein